MGASAAIDHWTRASHSSDALVLPGGDCRWAAIVGHNPFFTAVWLIFWRRFSKTVKTAPSLSNLYVLSSCYRCGSVIGVQYFSYLWRLSVAWSFVTTSHHYADDISIASSKPCADSGANVVFSSFCITGEFAVAYCYCQPLYFHRHALIEFLRLTLSGLPGAAGSFFSWFSCISFSFTFSFPRGECWCWKVHLWCCLPRTPTAPEGSVCSRGGRFRYPMRRHCLLMTLSSAVSNISEKCVFVEEFHVFENTRLACFLMGLFSVALSSPLFTYHMFRARLASLTAQVSSAMSRINGWLKGK